MHSGCTTHAVPDIGFSHSSLCILATLPAILRLPSTSRTADFDALRSHDMRGSRCRFQHSSLRISAALLPFQRHPSTSRLAVLNAIRSHVTGGSLHWFQPSSLCISVNAFLHASVHLARPQLRRRPDASPSSPDHDLHFQCHTPTHELEFGLWVVTAWVSPGPPGRVPRRGRPDISRKA